MHSETFLFLFLVSLCRQTHLLQNRGKTTSKTPHDTEVLFNCRRMGFSPGQNECLLYLSIYFLKVSCLVPHWVIHRHVGIFTGFLVWLFCSFGGCFVFVLGEWGGVWLLGFFFERVFVFVVVVVLRWWGGLFVSLGVLFVFGVVRVGVFLQYVGENLCSLWRSFYFFLLYQSVLCKEV